MLHYINDINKITCGEQTVNKEALIALFVYHLNFIRVY